MDKQKSDSKFYFAIERINSTFTGIKMLALLIDFVNSIIFRPCQPTESKS